MADAIGPNVFLPGSCIKVPKGAKCDTHPQRKATKRVVGETDSFGSEVIDMRDECYQKFKQEPDPVGYCDRCNCQAELKSIRDPEEGSSGRVYQLCETCYTALRKYHEDYS